MSNNYFSKTLFLGHFKKSVTGYESICRSIRACSFPKMVLKMWLMFEVDVKQMWQRGRRRRRRRRTRLGYFSWMTSNYPQVCGITIFGRIRLMTEDAWANVWVHVKLRYLEINPKWAFHINYISTSVLSSKLDCRIIYSNFLQNTCTEISLIWLYITFSKLTWKTLVPMFLETYIFSNKCKVYLFLFKFYLSIE